MDWDGVFVKYVLFIFNYLIMICGILVLLLGSIMVSKISDFHTLEQALSTNSVAITILVMGCIIFIISFLGYFGAIHENYCCTMTYSVIMMVMFLCHFVVIVYIWRQRPHILQSLDKVVEKIWNQRETDQAVMNTLQRSFKCCGYDSFADYFSTTLPASCCDNPSKRSCRVTDVQSRPGCLRAFGSFWDKNMDIISFAGLGVAAINCVAFIFAFCLAKQQRREQMYT